MLSSLNNTLRRFRRDASGAAYIEMAFVLIFMTILFIGAVEIVSYLKVRERMNKVADEMSGLLSNMPSWNVATNVNPVLVAAQSIATPYGASVSVRFCRGGTPSFDSGAFNRSYAGTTGKYGVGNCNHSDMASGNLPEIACSDARIGNQALTAANPTVQFVAVRAGCRYSAPLLGRFGLFDNQLIMTTSVSPMRYTMPW